MENVQPEAAKSRYCDFAMIPYSLFGKVSPNALGVFAGFAKFADFRTGKTFASVETVAKLLGIERRSVMRAIRELTAAGAMSSKRQGLGKPSIRTLQIPPIQYRAEGTKSVPLSDSSTRERPPHDFYNVIDMQTLRAVRH